MKTFEEILERRSFLKKLSWFFMALIITSLAYRLPTAENTIKKLSVYCLTILLFVIISSLLDVINDYYMTKDISKKRPIKGILQVIKILIFIVLSIILVAMLIGQDPIVLISGIGAFTAILSIVFKDALLGLVAGVQITSDNLLRIGDWIEIPSTGVEGTVEDISLMSVKVMGFDNTMMTVPAYTFLSTAFRNWHPVIDGKKRRLIITLPIDINTIKESGDSTNLAAFRKHMVALIKSFPVVRDDMAVICRTCTIKDGHGAPIEIMFFIKDNDYSVVCDITSTVTEAAITAAKKYDLGIFQLNSDHAE